jgi:hypothetical protein
MKTAMPIGIMIWSCMKSRQTPKTKKNIAPDAAPKLDLGRIWVFTARITTYNKYVPPMPIKENGVMLLGRIPIAVAQIAMRSKVSGVRMNLINFIYDPMPELDFHQ